MTSSVNFVAGLSASQKQNWKALIGHIRKGEYTYNHGNFETNHNVNQSRCALSIACVYDILDNGGSNSFHTIVDECGKTIDDLFGADCVDIVFGSGSEFGGYLDNNTVDGEDYDLDGETAAKLLSDFLGFGDEHGDIKFVTIHWKSNQTDNFESVEALQSFLDLNPKRAQGYRKITVTKLVPRTVYDEVVETITL